MGDKNEMDSFLLLLQNDQCTKIDAHYRFIQSNPMNDVGFCSHSIQLQHTNSIVKMENGEANKINGFRLFR